MPYGQLVIWSLSMLNTMTCIVQLHNPHSSRSRKLKKEIAGFSTNYLVFGELEVMSKSIDNNKIMWPFWYIYVYSTRIEEWDPNAICENRAICNWWAPCVTKIIPSFIINTEIFWWDAIHSWNEKMTKTTLIVDWIHLEVFCTIIQLPSND